MKTSISSLGTMACGQASSLKTHLCDLSPKALSSNRALSDFSSRIFHRLDGCDLPDAQLHHKVLKAYTKKQL